MKMIGTAALALTITAAGCATAGGPINRLGPDTYGAWDANRDNCLAQNEFGVNWNNEFGVWDNDRSGFVDDDEFGVGVGTDIGEFGAFGDWDLNDDNLLDTNEFGVGSFGVFDDDRNNCIGVNEWNAGIGFWD